MVTISLCIIVKDEEEVISRCLSSIEEVVDEIIVVDTGSSDNTKEIAAAFTNNIYDFKWQDDFSKARNFSFSKATKDYIFWIDADEFLDIKNKEKMLELKEKICDEIDIISMQTCLCKDNVCNPQMVSRRNRIVKRNKGFKWVGNIHEYLDVSGNCYDSEIMIIHQKLKKENDRNLQIYRNMISNGVDLNDRDLLYFGKELFYNKKFDEAINILSTYIEKDVWKEDKVDALCKIAECYLFKDDPKQARKYLYKTFEYVEPRGEILYDIANSFEIEQKYTQAIRWYEIILELPISDDCNKCINLSCYRLKPHLNLCYCYYEIDNLQKAYYHHLKCLQIEPNNPCVISNDKYFNSIIKK